MSLAVVRSRAGLGMEAPQVNVETHIAPGLPRLAIVGLPEAAVRESRDRVRSAILQSGLRFPSRNITINLAPAELPKQGGRYDLAIALGILAADRQLPEASLAGLEFLGELALSGALRTVRAVLPCALACRAAGHTLVVPRQDGPEAALVRGLSILGADHLLEVCAHLQGQQKLPSKFSAPPLAPEEDAGPDLAQVRGQHQAKRCLEIAAAGGHNLLLVGPPGVGKTLLAQCLPGLLPPLSEDQAVAIAAIHSLAASRRPHEQWRRPPFRSPHHSCSATALIGGGSVPGPGEVSLAHHGVLFLDELPEFPRHALESLREPLEAGVVSIARARHRLQLPGRFQLIAAMNPCPCGYQGHERHSCRCSPAQLQRYQSKLSGPLLDRIDLQLELADPPRRLFGKEPDQVGSAVVRRRVEAARSCQQERNGMLNAHLPGANLEHRCQPQPEARRMLELALKRGISIRSCHRLLKVARTIADLEPGRKLDGDCMAEALTLRGSLNVADPGQGAPRPE